MHWNPYLILLSYAISFLGSYVAVCFCEQFRLLTINETQVRFRNSLIILSVMAVSIGGIAIWCMHFIGMGAMVLMNSEGESISIHFDIGLTIISIIVAVTGAFIGLIISTYDRVYTKKKIEVLDMLVVDACQTGTKITAKKSVLSLALFKGLYILVLGGVVMGAGASAMHYLGMYAMRFDGYMEWDVGVIAASVAIAIVVSIVAFWILFRFLALFPQRESLRVMSAAVMGVAVCGMHYTGMYGAKFYYEPGKLRYDSNTMVNADISTYVALVVGMAIAWCLIIFAIGDMRSWYHHQDYIISKMDEIMSKVSQIPSSEMKLLVNKYKIIRGGEPSSSKKSAAVLPPLSPQNSKLSASNAKVDFHQVLPFFRDNFHVSQPRQPIFSHA